MIPAAGDGRRFKEAGYKGPKHYLSLGGKSMVFRVEDNVRPLDPDGERFIATKDNVGPTRGAVETVLRGYDMYHRIAKRGPDGPLVVANCDQLVLLPENPRMRGDGVIFTFWATKPDHSYVITESDFILDIVEKPEVPPTNRAVSGVYWFKEPGPFLDACRQVDHEGELYLSSALQVMLSEGYSLYAQDVPTAILGTPEDFQRFEVALACAAM